MARTETLSPRPTRPRLAGRGRPGGAAAGNLAANHIIALWPRPPSHRVASCRVGRAYLRVRACCLPAALLVQSIVVATGQRSASVRRSVRSGRGRATTEDGVRADVCSADSLVLVSSLSASPVALFRPARRLAVAARPCRALATTRRTNENRGAPDCLVGCLSGHCKHRSTSTPSGLWPSLSSRSGTNDEKICSLPSKIITLPWLPLKIIAFLNCHQFVIFDSFIAITVTFVGFVPLTAINLHNLLP
jgi:hypothetical protein